MGNDFKFMFQIGELKMELILHPPSSLGSLPPIPNNITGIGDPQEREDGRGIYIESKITLGVEERLQQYLGYGAGFYKNWWLFH